MRAVTWVVMTALALPSIAQAQQPASGAPQAKSRPEPTPEPRSKPRSAAKKPAKDAASRNASTRKKAGGDAASGKRSKTAVADEPAATPEQSAAYAGLPVAERIAIQSDLIWTGDLSGSIDPAFGDRAIAAVRSFQRRNKLEDSGILTAEQRRMLAASMRGRKDYHGWRLVEDETTPGVRLGIPAKLVPERQATPVGSRWSSARGEIQIETFREKMAGASLQELFEDLKKRPSSRRVEQGTLSGNSFALSGLQGLKKFHVRGYLKENEARGLTILFDQAMETIMLPLVDIIVSSYLPFGDPTTASTSRRVAYGSGIVVSAQGDVVTGRRLTEDCQGLIVAGIGRADRLAEDASAGLALVRINGARGLQAMPLSADPPKSVALTLIGVAEPIEQAGARRVTTTPAKLRGVEGARVLLDAKPASGFAGGAAVDSDGRLAGMIDVESAFDAKADTEHAAFVPTATISRFLESAGVAPRAGKGGAELAKSAVVRVICVRK